MKTREIKFRVWRKDESVFLTHPIGIYNSICNSFNESNLVFQQFTGLLDKTGKEIYEGDVLQIRMPPKRKVTAGYLVTTRIIFSDGCFWFVGEGFTDNNWRFYEESDREVIGNIFADPELLKNENEHI